MILGACESGASGSNVSTRVVLEGINYAFSGHCVPVDRSEICISVLKSFSAVFFARRVQFLAQPRASRTGLKIDASSHYV